MEALLGANRRIAARASWHTRRSHAAQAELVFRRRETVTVLDMGERIADGQRVARWRVEAMTSGASREIASGTTIGYRAIRRVAPVEATRLRVLIDDAVEPPLALRVAAYRA